LSAISFIAVDTTREALLSPDCGYRSGHSMRNPCLSRISARLDRPRHTGLGSLAGIRGVRLGILLHAVLGRELPARSWL